MPWWQPASGRQPRLRAACCIWQLLLRNNSLPKSAAYNTTRSLLHNFCGQNLTQFTASAPSGRSSPKATVKASAGWGRIRRLDWGRLYFRACMVVGKIQFLKGTVGRRDSICWLPAGGFPQCLAAGSGHQGCLPHQSQQGEGQPASWKSRLL